MEKKQVMVFKENGAEAEEKEIVAVEKKYEIEEIVEEAEKRIEILRKVIAIAAKRTNPRDWVDQGGKPYLCASGAEKIMTLFGVRISDVSYEKVWSEDDKGRFYIYQYKCKASWRAGEIEAIGACSSRDKFFAWDSKEKVYKPLSEVDETNIMKAAYTNMVVNAITRLLGLRNLTWDDLAEFGIKREEVAKVEYGKGVREKVIKDKAATQKQYAMIYATAKKKGISEDFVKELIEIEKEKTGGVLTNGGVNKILEQLQGGKDEN